MPAYEVTCLRCDTSAHVWSCLQVAASPAAAVAKATLPEAERLAWVHEHAGATHFQHPCSPLFYVTAEVLK